MPIEGQWVDRVVGLDGVRVDIAMMRTPDGHGRLELTTFHTPTTVSAVPENAPGNTLGLRSMMFAVDGIDAAVDLPPTRTVSGDGPRTPTGPGLAHHQRRRAEAVVPRGTGRLTCPRSDWIIGYERGTGCPMAPPIPRLPSAPGQQRSTPWI